MLSPEEMEDQMKKTFVLFYVDNGRLKVARFTGDALHVEIGQRFGKLPKLRHAMRDYILYAPVGKTLSYALHFDFAISREV